MRAGDDRRFLLQLLSALPSCAVPGCRVSTPRCGAEGVFFLPHCCSLSSRTTLWCCSTGQRDKTSTKIHARHCVTWESAELQEQAGEASWSQHKAIFIHWKKHSMKQRSKNLPQTMAKALAQASPLADLCGLLHCLLQVASSPGWGKLASRVPLSAVGAGSVASPPLHSLHNTGPVSATLAVTMCTQTVMW